MADAKAKEENLQETLQRVVVVLPSLNPDERMPQTVRGMLAAGFSHVLVVDDGSDSAHQGPFHEVETLPEVELLRHPVNLGKGRALKDAFAYLLKSKEPWDGCVTVDGDAQHSPKDTVRCALTMLRTGHLTFGCRNFDDPAVPKRNATGNKITRWVFRRLIGLPISDAQTGLRAFPQAVLPAMLETEGERFEYESNMLLDLKDKQIPFEEVSIDTIYINGNSTSHFHPVIDSYKVYKPILKRAKPVVFAAGSLLSAAADVGVFTLLNGILRLSGMVGQGTTSVGMERDALRILLATVTARVLSSILNYFWNRKAVFRSRLSNKRTMVRYYVLCVCQLGAAYGLTYLLSSVLFHTNGFGDTCLKILVDLFLFVISYRIQKEWVFADASASKKEKDSL